VVEYYGRKSSVESTYETGGFVVWSEKENGRRITVLMRKVISEMSRWWEDEEKS